MILGNATGYDEVGDHWRGCSTSSSLCRSSCFRWIETSSGSSYALQAAFVRSGDDEVDGEVEDFGSSATRKQ